MSVIVDLFPKIQIILLYYNFKTYFVFVSGRQFVYFLIFHIFEFVRIIQTVFRVNDDDILL